MTAGLEEPHFLNTNKLLRHLGYLAEWQATGHTKAPIATGVALTNVCNHRCPACNGGPGLLGFGVDNSSIPFELLEQLISDFTEMGIRAVTLGGGGDPTCYPRIADALRLFKRNGIETGMFTNGQLLRDDLLDAAVECMTWVRVSLDADNPEMYAATHGMKATDWERVLENIGRLVEKRRQTGSKITIGTSLLIGPQTMKGIVGAARIARDLGVDYIRMRPFFTWDGKLPFAREQAAEVMDLLAQAGELQTPTFAVTYPKARTEWVEEGISPAPYTSCHIHHFTTQVQPDAKVYLCCHTIDNPKYALGDLREKSFKDIWASEARRRVYENINFKDCATPCQMMNQNALLDLFNKRPEHENFI